MKTKIVFHLALIVALATLATGCCSSKIIEIARSVNPDMFYASAVYSTTNHDSFALEGIEYLDRMKYKPPFHTFMIVPQDPLVVSNFQAAINLQTNNSHSLERTVSNLPLSVTARLIPTNELPLFYYKITNLYTNENGFGTAVRIKEHHPLAGVIIFLPVAFAIDVVTSPIQLTVYCILLSGGMAQH